MIRPLFHPHPSPLPLRDRGLDFSTPPGEEYRKNQVKGEERGEG